MRKIQLFQSCYFPVIAPRVARSAQPWAERFNPFGIGKTRDKAENCVRHSTENVEEPIFLCAFLLPIRNQLCSARDVLLGDWGHRLRLAAQNSD
jgi:hypothetical protein